MKKRALRFGRDQHLIGVVHEAGTPSRRLGALLWNTGISHRSGPFRINVEIGEALAAIGLTVLRFDLSRLGDSEEAGQHHNLQERNTSDITDAVEVLVKDYEVDQVILIGLCSSAVDAYYYARRDPRICGLVMVDTFVYPTFKHKLIFFAQRLGRLNRWKRYLKRRLLPKKFQFQLPQMDYFEANYPSPVEAREDLTAMLQRGSEVLVIYTGGFSAYFSHLAQFNEMLQSPGFGPGLQLHRWPHTDHLFTMLEDRHRFISTLLAWVEAKLLRKAPLILKIPAPPVSTLQSEAQALPLTAATPHQDPQSQANEPDRAAQLLAQGAEQAAFILQQILQIFRSLLHPAQIDADEHFFDAGGSSLLAIRAAAQLSSSLNFHVSVVDIYAQARAKDLVKVLLERQQSLPQIEGAAPLNEPAIPQAGGTTNSLDADESIAIIGMACRVPGAENWQEFWDMLVQGREGIQRFRPDELDPSLPPEVRGHPNYVAARGLIEGDRFDHEFFKISRREALFTDPQQRVLLETCWQALEDAGYSADRRQHRIAVYAGVGTSTYLSRNVMQGHASPHSEEEYLALLANDKDFVATRIAYALDLRGPALSVQTACSTSLVAVIEAAKTLLAGDADLALAGAAAVSSPRAAGHLYQEGGIFSRDGHCRPFAAAASGTMFSDGSAVVVLKKLTAARRDQDHIYAVIKGWGLNNDGSDKSSFAAPSVQGQTAAIAAAFERAAWTPRSVAYVECHGTATPIGDPIELESLRRAFASQERGFCAIGSVKGNIGHLTAAAGTIGLIKAALALEKAVLPPSLHAYPLNPELGLAQSPFYVPEKVMPWPAQPTRRAGVSSFGVGGTNSHILIEQAPPATVPEAIPDPLDPWFVLSWSAQDAATCQRLGERLSTTLPEEPAQLYALAANILASRERFSYRQVIVGRNAQDLQAALLRSPKPLLTPGKKVQASPKPLVLLFPGQGSQYAQMGLELAATWPRFRSLYQQCIALFATECGLDVKAALLDQEAKLLQETCNTQAALFCLEWALGRALLDAGLKVQAMIGHSIGEIVAACLAHVFTLKDAVHLVYARGQAMQSARPGAMLAIRSAWQDLQNRLPSALSLAASNAPEAVVVSGPIDPIRAFALQMEAEGIACRLLDTSHAFHSAMMDEILPRFSAAFASLSLGAPEIPIVSTVSGSWLRAEQARDPNYWLQQLRQPVLFAEAVRCAGLNPTEFLEIGPKDALSRLIPQILGYPALAPTLSRSEPLRREEDVFADALARLWNAGQELFRPACSVKIPSPVYPFRGERLWLEARQLKPSQAQPALNKQERHDTSPLKPQLSRLQQLLAQLTGLALSELGEQRPWSELGLDSLLLTQWALKLQKEFTIDMNLQTLQTQVPHLQALSSAIQAQQPFEQSSRSPSNSHLMDDSMAEIKGSESASGLGKSEIAQLFERQLHLMEQQLAIVRGMAGKFEESFTAPARVEPFIDQLPIEGEIELFTDQGTLRLPRYQGAFIAKDARGQPALFVENPQQPGEIWHIYAA